ncbi:hypothetical protein F4820DRAFT_382022 [Hypoxylon rubiginosum]|uniref:Uncharacterized protein n=1 Tax=Hypoxylon rubiginosum TaxID=110542 RepID=A0ACB9ZEE9_9PEZI|nr:hypothetical protein F4820DRAFT_382022 [Hypoxylon rubiginosum]
MDVLGVLGACRICIANFVRVLYTIEFSFLFLSSFFHPFQIRMYNEWDELEKEKKEKSNKIDGIGLEMVCLLCYDGSHFILVLFLFFSYRVIGTADAGNSVQTVIYVSKLAAG